MLSDAINAWAVEQGEKYLIIFIAILFGASIFGGLVGYFSYWFFYVR